MESIDLRPEDYTPAPPSEDVVQRYGIGIVGCGKIAHASHLPAYAKFGYRIVAACDLVGERARGAAETYDIPFWTTNVDELLDRTDVDVIDLAVLPTERLELVERIASSGKHILSQKPFAPTLEEAQRMVEVCDSAGVTLMVNHQARWAPYHKALKVLLDRDVLGHLFSVVNIHRQNQDVGDSHIFYRKPPGAGATAVYFVEPYFRDFTILENGIHYVDLSRYFTGRTPKRVKATGALRPGQYSEDPMVYTVLCEYEPNDLMATIHFNNIASGLHNSPYLWLFDGTKASASITRHGTIGEGRTELTVAFKEDPNHRQVINIQGQWAPDAFGASMAEMLSALAEGREPQTSGRDNLGSIRLAHAAVASYKSGQAVEMPSEATA